MITIIVNIQMRDVCLLRNLRNFMIHPNRKPANIAGEGRVEHHSPSSNVAGF